MTSPRFAPRDYLVPLARRDFGRRPVAELEWHTITRGTPEWVRWRAAHHQAHVALRVNTLLVAAPRETVADIARLADCTTQRVRRVLRGEVIMRLEDLAAFEAALGQAGMVTLRPPG